MNEINILLQKIRLLRKFLEDSIQNRDLTDPQVIKISQELDELLNEYYRLFYIFISHHSFEYI
jgi:hypothetical protein